LSAACAEPIAPTATSTATDATVLNDICFLPKLNFGFVGKRHDPRSESVSNERVQPFSLSKTD
jgi:hypothetical protein